MTVISKAHRNLHVIQSAKAMAILLVRPLATLADNVHVSLCMAHRDAVSFIMCVWVRFHELVLLNHVKASRARAVKPLLEDHMFWYPLRIAGNVRCKLFPAKSVRSSQRNR